MLRWFKLYCILCRLGETCYIREVFNGRDDKGYFRYTQKIKGNIPKFDEKSSIEFDDYVAFYRLNRLGFLSGHFRISFSVDNVKYKMNVVEIFEFDQLEGCLDVSTFKMAVSEQKSSYERHDRIVRFKLKAIMGDQGMYNLVPLNKTNQLLLESKRVEENLRRRQRGIDVVLTWFDKRCFKVDQSKLFQRWIKVDFVTSV